MHNGHLIDRAHQSRRALTKAVVALLILGIALGAAIGVGVSRAFDSLEIEKRVRDFSHPAAAAVARVDNLRM